MRVLVAGRATQSPYAQALRSEAERELKRLIEVGGLEHDLLGLVTAAGGGLSADDLAEPTAAAPYRMGDVLRTRAGRTFTERGNGWPWWRCVMGGQLWSVRRVLPGDAHDSARDTLAQCLAEEGESTAALNWAMPLLNDDCARIDAAMALVPVVDPVLRRTLEAHILRHGEWSDALPAVLHLAPAAAPILVEALRQVPTAARTSAPSSK